MSRAPHQRHRLRGLLGLVICLLLVALINASVRVEHESKRWYTGTMRGPVSSPNVTLAVTDVELAQMVEGKFDPLETDGVFVLVHWSATVHHEIARLEDISLHTDDGLEISQRPEFRIHAAPPATLPGFTSSGVSVFEVPIDSAPGADFVMTGDRGLVFVYGYGIRVVNVVPADLPVAPLITLAPARTKVTP